MMGNRKGFFLCTALVMAGLAIFLGGNRWIMRVDGGAGTAHASGDAANDQRLAQLELEVRQLRLLLGQHSRGNGGLPGVAARRLEAPVDAPAQRQRFAGRLQASFVSEAVNLSWARKTRVGLEQSLLSYAAEQPDWPVPDSTSMACRSATCRIEARYADEDSAMYGVQLLQSAFAASLPRTHQYSVSNADGSVTVVMYASGNSG